MNRKRKANPQEFELEKKYPNLSRWVRGCGWIEIGDQDGFGFIVRALDYGGLIFEDKKAKTLTEALAALEKGGIPKNLTEG